MDDDLASWPKAELYRVVGILSCNRMIFSYTPGREAEIDAKITALNEEIARRKPAGAD